MFNKDLENMPKKNLESKKYIEKAGLLDEPDFKAIINSDGGNRKDILDILKNGLFLVSQEPQKALTYYLAISLLDDVDNDLSSVATDIMLYAEEKDNISIPPTFLSIEDIEKKLNSLN